MMAQNGPFEQQDTPPQISNRSKHRKIPSVAPPKNQGFISHRLPRTAHKSYNERSGSAPFMGRIPMDKTSPKPFVFVLMPFSDDFADIYEVGIKPACRDAGAYCERVDEQIFVENILERIYNQIAKADIIVAEMTGRNPNVFYEVGYAYALNKRVILLTRNTDDIPFDLKHYPHIVYEGRIAYLKSQLESRVRWCIENSILIVQSRPLAIVFDETRHCYKESNNQGEVCRITVKNQGRTTVKNATVKIINIAAAQEEQQDDLRRLVDLKLCVSVNPFGAYFHPDHPPESSVILHPGDEVTFDFLRLSVLPGNHLICHSNFFLMHPQTQYLYWEQRPSGVIPPGKYTVTISAQGDDLDPEERQFAFSSSTESVIFRPL
jgi:nucleoside 2-deoxyribosyltransferase